MEPITIFQSFVNIRTIDDYFDRIKVCLNNHTPTTFFYLNTYSSYLCNKNAEFRAAFNAADFIIPDGSSIVFAIKHLKGITVEKVTTNHTFIDRIAAYFNSKGVSLFLFGSEQQVLNQAISNLQLSYPKIVIAGSHHGFIESPEENEKVIALIKSSKADVLFVGMGMPISELWIAEHKHRLDVPCIMTIGNLIDIIAGKRRIAPRWVFNSGFEWLFRLIQEPVRLSPRYIKANTQYLIGLLQAFFSTGK
jgi:exopolysaccharide biosynthesis WecB/TagA/CpsF family protein